METNSLKNKSITAFSASLLAIFLLAAFGGVISAQPADTPWPMFRHDARHTGVSQYSGSPGAGLKWSYYSGWPVLCSPAIGTDGSIFIGMDRGIYRLSSTGSFRWSFRTGEEMNSSPAIGSGGEIYIGSDDYYLYSLNSDGTLRWTYRAYYYMCARQGALTWR